MWGLLAEPISGSEYDPEPMALSRSVSNIIIQRGWHDRHFIARSGRIVDRIDAIKVSLTSVSIRPNWATPQGGHRGS